jgi:arylsulfatase A-like enzyme
MEFFDSNGHLRGMKRDLYDGGVKTPFIARWPGYIQPGSTSDHLSAFWDFLPTASELAGVDPPDDIDGISYLPTLLGKEKQQPKHTYLYWEFYELGGRQAVLKDHWKAIRYDLRKEEPSPTELYNLHEDPGELNNIAMQHPELVVEMEQYMQEAHTPFPIISLYGNEAKD